MATTLKLIHEKGFKATTMRDIASNLNFEVANVYNYIDSKQSLLESFLDDISDEFHLSIDNIMASTYSPEEKLRSLISANIQLTASKPYEVALLMNDWRHLNGNKLKDFLKRRMDYENKVSSIITEGIKRKQFRKMDIEIATYSVLASLRWLYSKYTDRVTKLNPIEIEKQISDFIFAGIGRI
ncbi:MAG: TetR/AcrR family transcriptional regulator [Bacteroidia bacterium]|nr:TetR/AcrR family transcriptional regulator [Bacteroidia bacterium]NND51989.1 TetR/AcrR family transcriptional regulator [Flavobacteriaceae bacterium]